MHKIYHTEGLVIRGINFGEADKYLTIYTRDFGMIRAQAQGIRKLSSKLRYSLQEFSYTDIDLVQGKDIWRITNAKKKELFKNQINKQDVRKIVNNIFNLLERLCHGEEKNEILFNDLVQGFFLLRQFYIDKNQLDNIEFVLVLRILHHLGYLGESENLLFFINSPFTSAILPIVSFKRKLILSHINNALLETQL